MKNFKLNLLYFTAALVFTSCGLFESEPEEASPEGRAEYDLKRLADPETGEIPEGIRMREIAYASSLPKSGGAGRSGKYEYKSIGPYNVGGRTRAFKIDVSNHSVFIAGGVSGGMWRTENSGLSWEKTTSNEQPVSVNCLVQDIRPDHQDTWYYGTGEYRGNSASKSHSAPYRGNGIYKSTDGGKSWQHLSSTEAEPHQSSDWSYVFNVAVDTSRHDSDIVFAAVSSGIMRSNDGGETWSNVLSSGFGFGQPWSNIHLNSAGVFYAHINSDKPSSGIYRSEDGLNWTLISSGQLPGNHQRLRFASAKDGSDMIYMFANTPGSGQHIDKDNEMNERVSFFKYEYISGDGSGSGGSWQDRSHNLTQSNNIRNQLRIFTNYTMQLAVKPDDPDVVFIGGTSMFRSTDAFATSNNIAQIGGYDAQGYANYHYDHDGQHPDQHEVDFMPGNPHIMLVSSDGGVHRTDNCMAFKVIWQDLNNGYVTGQFYAVNVIHDTAAPYVAGGLQDNGTWFSNHNSSTESWMKVRGGDGAYAALVQKGTVGYFSTQFANVERVEMNPDSGEVHSRDNIMGVDMSDFNFIHPWALDPSADNVMYMPEGNKIHRNMSLNSPNPYMSWEEIIELPSPQDITAITVSNDGKVVYAGTSSQTIYKITDPKGSNPQAEDITGDIQYGGYTSNIAVHPEDNDRVLVVYSNYSVRSLWYTETGGDEWLDAEGNLRGEPDNPDMPQLAHRGNGPSCRWAQILPVRINGNDSLLFLVGTSTGLFAATELSEETEWIQQGSQVIGNNVVEMIDTRLSDGFTAIASHGNGVFTTYYDDLYTHVPDQSEYEAQLNIKCYPNPALNHLNVQYQLNGSEFVKLSLYNLNGSLVRFNKIESNSGTNEQRIDLSSLPSGTYFLTLKGETFQTTEKIIKR